MLRWKECKEISIIKSIQIDSQKDGEELEGVQESIFCNSINRSFIKHEWYQVPSSISDTYRNYSAFYQEA